MAWLSDRLREDSTRSGLSQLAVIVLLVILVFGGGLSALDEAQLALEKLMALAAGAAGLASALARIVSPERKAPVPELSEAASKGLERLADALSDRK